MTLQQMRLILEISRTGSLSKAASNLFISQPNASNSIKALELEVGFRIFQRSSTGMILTEKGKKTVKNAEMVLHYVDNIMKIQSQGDMTRHLHLGVIQYTPLREAFERMVIDYQEKGFLDFSCKSYGRIPAMEDLCALKLDLYALLYDRDLEQKYRKELESWPLTLLEVGEVNMHINFRHGHPLIGDGIPDFSLLKNYPYVDYVTGSLADFTNHQFGGNFELPYKYKICVEQQELRCSIVGKTDAFSTGFRLTREVMERYGLVSFPLPFPPMKLGVIIRDGEEAGAEIQYYIQTLKQVLEEM